MWAQRLHKVYINSIIVVHTHLLTRLTMALGAVYPTQLPISHCSIQSEALVTERLDLIGLDLTMQVHIISVPFLGAIYIAVLPL